MDRVHCTKTLSVQTMDFVPPDGLCPVNAHRVFKPPTPFPPPSSYPKRPIPNSQSKEKPAATGPRSVFTKTTTVSPPTKMFQNETTNAFIVPEPTNITSAVPQAIHQDPTKILTTLESSCNLFRLFFRFRIVFV